MIGAIIGDIAGSTYEFNNLKSKNFELFKPYMGESCSPTDDSVMTLSIAKAFLSLESSGSYGSLKNFSSLPEGEKKKLLSAISRESVRCMKEVGRNYPYCGYGRHFFGWIFSDSTESYNSYGNGAAMRISAAAYAAGTLEDALAFSDAATAVTHNHPEGLKGARATASSVWLALHGADKKTIEENMRSYYELDFTLDGIREGYSFDVSCQGSVPQAFRAFLEADGFEDTIKNAISIGGDSDTIACIAGGVAGAYYGVPGELVKSALTFLDERLKKIYLDFKEVFRILP